MNRKIGIIASAINLFSVLGFAASMLTGWLAGSYLSSIFIAFSFVSMMAAFAAYALPSAKVAGYSALAFGGMYAFCNILVYFVQLTTVRLQALSPEATSLLSYQQFGLMFNLDLLGYCLMAVATFFAGLTVTVRSKADTWLKWLLVVHGVFAITCFVMPLLGLFHAGMEGGDFIGTAVLLFWCAYFAPVGVLSMRYFAKAAQA